jgi:hypothetical protein
MLPYFLGGALGANGFGHPRGLARREPSRQEVATISVQRGPRIEQAALALHDGVRVPIG